LQAVTPSDLAEYLDQHPFLEYPLHGSGDPSPPVGRVLEDPEPQPEVPATSDPRSEPRLSTPVTPERSTRATEAERDTHIRDMMQMVMDIFPGARWTTRAEYQQAATRRDRQGRRRRG
jgi:hypothetical protein